MGPSTWQRTTLPVTSTSLTPGTAEMSGTAPSNVAWTLRAERWRMSERGTDLDERPAAQDADPVAQRLHLAQDVRGQEDRLAPLARLLRTLAEDLLHERVQAARGLVQHEQVSPGHEGGDEEDLLAVALGVLADLLGRVEVEALDELVPVGRVDLALHPAEEVERLGPGERGPQVGLAGHVGQVAVRLDSLAAAVEPEDLRLPGAGLDQPEQEPDRGGLAGAVGPR